MNDKLPTHSTHRSTTRDVLALWYGIGFCVLASLAIWLLGGWLDGIEFLPDEGYSWYYWKLPEKTTAGWLSAWGLYVIHQLSHFIHQLDRGI